MVSDRNTKIDEGNYNQNIEGGYHEQKGNHGIGHMDGGVIKDNAKVAGKLEENNSDQSQNTNNKVVVNINPHNESTTSEKEDVLTGKQDTIKMSIKEGNKEASIEAPYSAENFQSLLGFLRQRFDDNSLGLEDIKKSSIKLILRGSEQGLENIAAAFRSGELAPLLKQQFNLELEDAKLMDSDSSDNYQKNKSQKLLAFTIAGNVSQADIDILKAALIDTSDDDDEIETDKKLSLIEEIRNQGAKGRNLRGVDLSDADLRRADLRRADLSSADLSGADLSDADLSSADLSSADLSVADLSGANLSGANLSGANLCEADLKNACLSKYNFILEQLFLHLIHLFRALIDACCGAIKGANRGIAYQRKTFRGVADLSRANLSRANLCGANLSRVKLIGANLSEACLISARLELADLRLVNLSGAELRMANLSQAIIYPIDSSNLDLRETNLTKAKLRGANLNEADLSKSNLSNADFRGANLNKADLSETDLRRANLSRAVLSDAYLTSANLNRANLSASVLDRANLRKCCFRLANLSQTNLHRADLSEADLSKVNLSEADLRGAYFTSRAKSTLFRGLIQGQVSVKRAKFGWNRGICLNEETILRRFGAIIFY